MRLHRAHPSHQDCLILTLSSMFTVPNLLGVWQQPQWWWWQWQGMTAVMMMATVMTTLTTRRNTAATMMVRGPVPWQYDSNDEEETDACDVAQHHRGRGQTWVPASVTTVTMVMTMTRWCTWPVPWWHSVVNNNDDDQGQTRTWMAWWWWQQRWLVVNGTIARQRQGSNSLMAMTTDSDLQGWRTGPLHTYYIVLCICTYFY